MQDLFNKQNVIVFLLVLLVIVTMTWLMLPRLVKFCASMIDKVDQEQKFRMYLQEGATEGFNAEENVAEKIDMPKPEIDVAVGSVVDGPGFEKGGVDGVGQEILSTIPSNYYFLDDGADGAVSVQHNLCSKSCCSAQWPTPFKQKYDPYVCSNKSEYVSSQLFCNNSFQDSGLIARSG